MANELSAEKWKTQLLRMTVFPLRDFAPPTDSWWVALTGQDSDSKTSRPKKGEYEEEGNFESTRLILKIEPSRIDWVMRPLEVDDKEEPVFPVLGEFSKNIDGFQQLMLRWLSMDVCPPVKRLAVGATLIQPVHDRIAGYKRLLEYLPSIKDINPEETSDFLYQINRPRKSLHMPGLKINRLSKWSALSFQFVALDPSIAVTMTTHEAFACRVELDINTAKEFSEELGKEMIPSLLKELVSLGMEISLRGDIP
ncbi:MAG: hypothetical protein C4293_03070 [Nitrospiraceae bacterium]